ncbi:MAG: flagellar filament capping protein FliD [Candidatus Zixiibacteriota bacterium]
MSGLSSIEGINSGLNTTEIVDAILAIERQAVVLLQEQQAEKTNIVSSLKALQAKFLALSTELANLSRSTTFEVGKVTVSDEAYLTASAAGRVGAGSYDVQILSLARNHQIASQGFSDQSLASFGTGTINISVAGGSLHAVTIDADNNSLVGIKNAINDADIGVRASIVNDGSSSNPYRLVLTANETGVANKITVTSNLTGGNDLDFQSVSFDNPESVSTDSGSSSQITLGATASYTGSENKIYTFTVAGTGAQTVGTDTITINWTDGANSGSIQVTQADTEVPLTGTGADGLKLSFSAGTLTAGDIFQVSAFAPTLQEASDARIAIGSSGGAGSPVIVTSDTNTFTDLIDGLSVTVHKETASGESVTINTDIDLDGVKAAINRFIDCFNDVNDFINDQNTYNQETKESGVLFGDFTLQMMQNSLRGVLASAVSGLTGQYTSLYAIGIRTNAVGRLAIVNNSRFEEALRENLDDVIKLFTNAGSSSSSFIEFVSATSETQPGQDYDIDITTAATQGRFQGTVITDPGATPITLNSSNNRLQLVVDGVTSQEIVLAEKIYSSADELVTEIQSKIDSDSAIGSRGLTVEWVSTGSGTGYLNLVGANYGSASRVEMVQSIANNAYDILGLSGGSSLAGTDVAGTINGEAADGSGQFLTGKDDNASTAGLKLRVTLDSSQLVDGVDATITITKGVAAKLSDLVGSFTKAGDGLFDRRTTGYQNQIAGIEERISDIEERLQLRRESLFQEFYDMEVALGELNAQSQFLSNQLTTLSTNWFFNQSNG